MQNENKKVYAERRAKFMKAMDGGIAILKTHPVKHRSADGHYSFRTCSDFYYLTGLDEPESIVVISPENKKQKFTLFVRPKNREREIWDGFRLGPDGAKKTLGADAAYSIDKFEEVLPTLLPNSGKFFYRLGFDREFDDKIQKLLQQQNYMRRKGGKTFRGILDPTAITNSLRLIKGTDEIDAMQKAADITAKGHIAAMKAAKPGMSEYEIDAMLNYEYRRNGAQGSAYSAIVAAGANACILHYVENDKKMKNGDLLLIDSGAEYGYYACDVTRTYPVNGKFSPEQRAVYNVVLDAQMAVINMVKPGLEYAKMHRKAIEVLTKGLLKIGLLKGNLKKLIEKREFFKFYMHGTGHWLGLDVHDECPYVENGKSIKLRPGMVFTVEPGLYINNDLKNVPKKWRGIGVRIEDDVLVTKTGCRVLTAAIPKKADDIEKLMNGK